MSDVSGRVRKEFVQSGPMGDERRDRKEPIAIFQDVLTIESAMATVIGVVGHAARPYLLDRHCLYDGRMSGKSAADLVNADLMAAHVWEIDRVSLREFGIFLRCAEENPLSFLGDCITWPDYRQADQRHGFQNKGSCRVYCVHWGSA